jgi:thiamine kinase-like enzyme
LAPMHGDFWPGNVLLDGDRLAVTDWETYQPGCLPFRDLFLFLTTYVQNYAWRWWPPGETGAERFRRGFLANTWLSRQVAVAITSFFHNLQLPPPAARLFYPLFLLEMATPTAAEGEKRRQQAEPWQATLRQYARATATILDTVSE